jgi:hypothetical protein
MTVACVDDELTLVDGERNSSFTQFDQFTLMALILAGEQVPPLPALPGRVFVTPMAKRQTAGDPEEADEHAAAWELLHPDRAEQWRRELALAEAVPAPEPARRPQRKRERR